MHGSEPWQLGVPTTRTNNSHLQSHLLMIIYCFILAIGEYPMLNPSYNQIGNYVYQPGSSTFQASSVVVSWVEIHTIRPNNTLDIGIIV